MNDKTPKRHEDWGEASVAYDELRAFIRDRDLTLESEAQTRYDVIDRMIREVHSWPHGQVGVEEPSTGERKGYIDYLLVSGDDTILIEAKKAGAAFPSPTRRKQLKLTGSVLGSGAIGEAIEQAQTYANEADPLVVVVTNGLCWCVFARQTDYKSAYANLLFPFGDVSDAESLFNLIASAAVERGSLRAITHALPRVENRLLSVVADAAARVDRNNVADYLLPALNNALYADALLKSPEALKRCFVTTEARTKFDSHLGMHLADIKSPLVRPAPRIRTGKQHGRLAKALEAGEPSYAPPVTLIIGPVGAGKTTYLRHFHQVSGREVLTKANTHWIYIDFEALGRLGNPRAFIYRALLDYLGADHPGRNMDYQSLVAPAYSDDIDRMTRGPLAPIKSNRELFQQKISEHITRDYEAVEPYVNRVFRHLAERDLCLIVLDNVDLYEDDRLETLVFSEGLALSKRLLAHVVVSLRDTTFVRHKTDPTFDAFELRKLWLDPPPFKAVLSSRLSYSRAILKGQHVQIPLAKSMHLDVPDLGAFFDIVQRSILQGHTGDHIASFADTNIRKGLDLVTNFLTSGHIQADRAIKIYLRDAGNYYFPNHEIFKGMMLAQWKHYKEGRAECLNIFDARLGSKRLSLLRLFLVAMLFEKARSADTVETPVKQCVEVLGPTGASEDQIIDSLADLMKYRIVRTVTAESLDAASTVVLTPCGGYYLQHLCHTFEYCEATLLDTAIEDLELWHELADLTARIEKCGDIAERMGIRVERVELYTDYLVSVANDALPESPAGFPPRIMEKIRQDVMQAARIAQGKARRYYGGGMQGQVK